MPRLADAASANLPCAADRLAGRQIEQVDERDSAATATYLPVRVHRDAR